MTRDRSLVLCYHAVSDTWPDALALAPKVLMGQVRALLRRGRAAGTAEDALAGRRVFHVTFDDAYRELRRVLPELVQLRVPVTVFACSGYAEDGRPLDVPELTERTRAFEDEVRTMTWEELRESASMGVDIGSHTVSHLHLTRLGDAELRRELEVSKERIEDELQRPCRFVAYPYGEHDDRVRAAAQAAGYEAAFALDSRSEDPYAVPRVDIYRDDDRFRFALKTSAAYRSIQTGLTTLRRTRARAGQFRSRR
jgi:peptidoglycan/xylan/chitin deacetylase (PgdA/CDA1 family)